ncbi:MAG: hypothetical protein FWC73_14405 [Defluviitaleaceae bacterium]|nr:hypothetical protein [Defluviitaleaceae bacterium]
MTSRERVKRSISFTTPDKYPRDHPEPYGSDLFYTGLNPCPDMRPRKGLDNWGCLWESYESSNLGEVKDSPLKDWNDFDKLTIPSLDVPGIWDRSRSAREKAGDKYVLGNVSSLYERVHFVRGLDNTWCDIMEEPDNLKKFVNLLADMNIEIIRRYAEFGVDGIINCDDWGLQNRLMISPDSWREIWKPAYKRVYDAAHAAGLDTWLHSCGYILDIMEDLIEIGLDVIDMDQQMNMGLDNLQKFTGRITFFAPVDIQAVMPNGNPEEIKAYCRKMSEYLGTKAGGLILKWYSDPVGAGHSQESVDVMCQEFIKISDEIYGRPICK